jgi:hypothetical protein
VEDRWDELMIVFLASRRDGFKAKGASGGDLLAYLKATRRGDDRRVT